MEGSLSPSVFGLMITLLALCTLRTWFTVFPSRNPLPLDTAMCVSTVVLLLWITLSLLCAASVFTVVEFVKGLRSVPTHPCPYFAQAQLGTFVSRLTKPMSRLAMLMMLFSVCYDIHTGWFVYTNWVHTFPWPLQVLEPLPALALSLQTLGQGIVLLFANACPVASARIRTIDRRECFKLVNFHMLLNFVLFFHPLTMIVVVTVTQAKEINTNIFLVFALVKLIYHISSAVSFHRIAKRKQSLAERQIHKLCLTNFEHPVDTAIDMQNCCATKQLLRKQSLAESQIHKLCLTNFEYPINTAIDMQNCCATKQLLRMNHSRFPECKDVVIALRFEFCVEELEHSRLECLTAIPLGDCCKTLKKEKID